MKPNGMDTRSEQGPNGSLQAAGRQADERKAGSGERETAQVSRLCKVIIVSRRAADTHWQMSTRMICLIWGFRSGVFTTYFHCFLSFNWSRRQDDEGAK